MKKATHRPRYYSLTQVLGGRPLAAQGLERMTEDAALALGWAAWAGPKRAIEKGSEFGKNGDRNV